MADKREDGIGYRNPLKRLNFKRESLETREGDRDRPQASQPCFERFPSRSFKPMGQTASNA